MTVSNPKKTENFTIKRQKKEGRRKYIPGLAAFFFKPFFSWGKEEAEILYFNQIRDHYDKIIYKDCIKGMKKLNSESVDLIIADPPFGLDFSGKESIYNRNKNLVLFGYKDVDRNNYRKFSKEWISELPRLMKNTSSAIIISGWTNLTDVLVAIEDSNLNLVNHIIWHYQFGVFTKRKFVTSHYHLLWVVKDIKKYFFNKIEHYPLDIWFIPREYKNGLKKNGTKLPIGLVSRCIHYLSKPGDLILDPFMGNGTTAISAKGNYRHFIGYEINKNMKKCINEALKKVKLGQFYIPYIDLEPNIEKISKKYPRAYKEYLRIISS